MRSLFSRTVAGLLVAVLSAALLSGTAEDKRVAIYSTVANYSLPVIERNRQDYVGLLEALEPLGTVSAQVSGSRWKLRYNNNTEAEFNKGKRGAKAKGASFDLSGNFVLDNGRGFVPLADLSSLLSRILGGPVTFNPKSRRIFVGNVAIHFTAEITKTPSPQLIMHFSAPVNPAIATEPGKLEMKFSHDPVVAPASPKLTFDNNFISSAIYTEGNGEAQIVVDSSAPVLASFSDDRRTITVGPPPSPPAPSESTAQTKPPVPVTPVQPPAPISLGLPAPAPVHYFAVVDASHGGDERGAMLTSQIAEKDVTLGFARLLRQELDSRGLRTLLLRDGDVTIPLDRRAALTNAAAPTIYIAVHAASDGTGVRLYTGLTEPGAGNVGLFIPWESAQAAFLGASDAAATSLAAALHASDIPVRTLTAPLRPLNNITTAALAVEVAPPTGDVAQITSAKYQQPIAVAIATGVAEARGNLQGVRR